jgi:multidrug resistance efflux pump
MASAFDNETMQQQKMQKLENREEAKLEAMEEADAAEKKRHAELEQAEAAEVANVHFTAVALGQEQQRAKETKEAGEHRQLELKQIELRPEMSGQYIRHEDKKDISITSESK